MDESHPFVKFQHGNLGFLNVTTKEQLIYMRPEAIKFWDYLNAAAVGKFHLEISGSPGVGKSSTTWA